MKPVLIYFREVPFKENKFVLDFSDEKRDIQPIQFKSNSLWYIASLNCKLELEEEFQQNENIKKLYDKSKILKDKGSDYFCDIDFINLVTPSKFKQPFPHNEYRFERTPENIENYSYKYSYLDTTDNKIKEGKIYSPYSQLIAKGFTFKLKGQTGFSDMTLVTQLDKESEKLKSFFLHTDASNKTEYSNHNLGESYYRDINLFFVYDKTYKQWQTTQPEFFRSAIFEKVSNSNFNEKQFATNYYQNQKKGRFVMGSIDQRLRLGNRKYMMPIVFVFNSLVVYFNEEFYTTDVPRNNSFLKQNGIKDLGSYTLTKDDLAELNSMHSNFQLKTLRKWKKDNRLTSQRWSNELIYYPLTKYGSYGQPQYNISNFQALSKNTKKYSGWLDTDNEIFIKPYIRNAPTTLLNGEKLFDKDVIEVKELVKDIGNVEKLSKREQKNFILYDNNNVIKETFFTEIKRNISSYGMISINYNYDNKSLINWQNRLEFAFKNDINEEFLTFQLEDAIEPKTVATEDSKMTNITILKLDELLKKKIVNNFFIQGLQRFDKFKTLNPLNIQVIDTNIRDSISLYARSNYRYTFRFIANSLLFSSAIIGDTNTIFIVADNLLDAKDVYINNKLFQGIGTIYTSEIENWAEIKKGSHWVNVKLTDVTIPIATKHFAFGFETYDFNNLLNFEHSLLNDKAELIKFKKGEKKVPALNFSIQILK